jgi:uncharacterized membrane protein
MIFDELCHAGPGNWRSVGNFGLCGWIGFIVGLIVSMLWAIRRSRIPAAAQPHANEILKAKYTWGEITREQYELMKQDIA